MSMICDNGIEREMTEEEQATYDAICAEAAKNPINA